MFDSINQNHIKEISYSYKNRTDTPQNSSEHSNGAPSYRCSQTLK